MKSSFLGDFPSGPVVKSPPANAGDIATCHGAAKPVCHNYWSLWALEPELCDKRTRNEKLHTATKASPYLLQMEKAREQPQRPSANIKNKRSFSG